MTDGGKGNIPRIDLRSLDLDGENASAEAVVGAVMRQIRSGRDASPQPVERLSDLRRVRRYLLAAAAAWAAIAAGSVVKTGGRPPAAAGLDLVASWTASQHVPTNGELLAVYQGYRP